jgi:hypothetical protein
LFLNFLELSVLHGLSKVQVSPPRKLNPKEQILRKFSAKSQATSHFPTPENEVCQQGFFFSSNP